MNAEHCTSCTLLNSFVIVLSSFLSIYYLRFCFIALFFGVFCFLLKLRSYDLYLIERDCRTKVTVNEMKEEIFKAPMITICLLTVEALNVFPFSSIVFVAVHLKHTQTIVNGKMGTKSKMIYDYACIQWFLHKIPLTKHWTYRIQDDAALIMQ